jgi:ABC-type transporter Mla subunit MlaD
MTKKKAGRKYHISKPTLFLPTTNGITLQQALAIVAQLKPILDKYRASAKTTKDKLQAAEDVLLILDKEGVTIAELVSLLQTITPFADIVLGKL